MRRALRILAWVLVIVAVLVVANDVQVWWQAHPELSACYSNAYATYGPDGAHACPVPGAFPWWRDVPLLLVVFAIVAVLAWRTRRMAK